MDTTIINFRISPGKQLLALLTILGAAIFLRVAFLGIIEFKGDEFTAIRMAYDNIHDHPTLIGLRSSVDLLNPPFFIYLLSLPVAISTDPLLVTGFIILLNCLALGLLYLFIRTVFSHNWALPVLLLIATSPWAILYSRKIWAQDCLLFFILIFYLVLASYLKEPKDLKIWVMAGVLAAITQLHMSAWFLVMPIFIFFWLFKIPFHWRHVIIVSAIFLLAYLPYIAFHVRTDFINIHEFLSRDKPTLFSDLNMKHSYRNIQWAYIITSGTNLRYSLGSEFDKFFQNNWISIPYVFCFLFIITAIAGTIHNLIFTVRKLLNYSQLSHATLSQQFTILFVLIFFVTQGCFFLFRVENYPHYNIIFYPILFIFSVQATDALLRRFPSVTLRQSLSGALILVLCSNLFVTFSLFNYIQKYPNGQYGDYGSPYNSTKDQWQRKIQLLLQK